MKNNLPSISIVTPSYNQGKYLEETIMSVISQDYDNFEYIIVDGLSNDNTHEILEKYKNNPKIHKIICEKDNGQTDALIKGFNICKGDIYCWINSDDLLKPHTLSKVATYFAQNPNVDILVGILDTIDEDSKLIGIREGRKMKNLDWLIMPQCIGQQSTFYRANVYKQIGGLNQGLEYSMDYDLFMRFAIGGFKFLYVSDVLSSFRFHNSSKTVSLPYKFWKEEFYVFKKNGGKLFSPFYYWKVREIISWIIKQKLFRKPRYQ